MGIILILLFVVLIIDGGLLKLIVFIICLISIIRIMKSKRKPNRQIILIGITILFGWIAIEAIKQLSINTFYGGDDRNHWQTTVERGENTQKLCEKALEQFPKDPYQISSVIIEENSVLREQVITELLFDRKLVFIEFKVYGTDNQAYIMLGNYPQAPKWTVNQKVGEYVRVELDKPDSKACVLPESLTRDMNEQLEFYAKYEQKNKCIKVTNIDSPTSIYKLDFKEAKKANKYQPQGNYQLIDVTNNNVIAELPVSNRGMVEGVNFKHLTSDNAKCRAPYTTLASLVGG